MFIWTPKGSSQKRGLNLVKAIVPLKIQPISNCKRQTVYRLINNELNPDFKVLTLVYMILLS
jgi:hypothetical protein